ncbi:MAG TPA: DUF3341 domain-containing protein [Bryobacteraceae bacterium]|jgi:hypothetical protein|nr:DUF3341 domain-containing protein [Bryobacteraceae bacterium]
MTRPRPYGMAAEFDDAGALVRAVRKARAAGYRRFETYSPHPIEEIDQVMQHWDMIAPIGFVSALTGGVIGFYMQYFIAADVYPTNIGGRPLNSWQAFVVITFALTVLFGLIAVFGATVFFQGMPSLYHPLFKIPSFRRASSNGYFLCIESWDEQFQPIDTSRFLQSLYPINVWEVDYE